MAYIFLFQLETTQIPQIRLKLTLPEQNLVYNHYEGWWSVEGKVHCR